MAKTKGSVIEGIVRYLRKNRTLARGVLDPSVHGYLSQVISPTRWYPESDLLALIRGMVRMLPGQEQRALEEMGRASAQRHQEGTYGHLIAAADGAGSFAVRTTALWSTMHDSGRMRACSEGDHGIRFVLEGYGHPSREMCTIIGGYLAEVLRLSGMAAPTARKEACVLDGADRCVWLCSWRPGPDA